MPLTDSNQLVGGAAARLAVRRRRWIRLADEPLKSALEPTLFQDRYGMYGEVTQTVGTLASDFQYAGYYYHAPSGLNLTSYRAYSPSLGRWINRDPIGEDGGVNLYDYVKNEPIRNSDPLGLQLGLAEGNWIGMGYSSGTTTLPGQLNTKGGESGDYMPMLPGDVGFMPPMGCLDRCAWLHDTCMHIGHTIEDKGSRRCWNRQCHKDASKCFRNCGGPTGYSLAGLFGLLGQIGGAGEYNPNIIFPPTPTGAPLPGSLPLRGL